MDSYSELVEITSGMRDSAYQIVATNVATIKELPSMLDKMDKAEAPKEKVETVINIAKTIGKDADTYIQELDEVDQKFLDIKSKGVKRPKVAAKNYATVLGLSTRYHDISSRIAETTAELTNDMTDIYIEVVGEEDPDDAVEAVVEEQPVEKEVTDDRAE